LGIERLIMIEQNFTDIRHLVYPYQYTSTAYTDSEIASDLTVINTPQQGAALVRTITQQARDHADDPSPTQVIVYNDCFLGEHVTIRLVENEAEKRLLGPAAFNHLVVKNGNILGVPANRIPSNATHTQWTYMDGVAHWVVNAIENAIANDTHHLTLRVRLVKRLADINLTISDVIRRYIEGKQAKIDVRGPLFAEFHVDIG
jgi:O-phosphoseryl-tRNA synthetase